MPAGPRKRIKAKETKRHLINSKVEIGDDDDGEIPSPKGVCFQLEREIPGNLTIPLSFSLCSFFFLCFDLFYRL